MKKRIARMLAPVFMRLAPAMARVMFATYRVAPSGGEAALISPERPVIYVSWHRWLVVGAYFFRRSGVAVPVSTSRDGELATRAAVKFGYRVARGSSSRGASAVAVAMARAIRGGTSCAIPLDGPRGPAEMPKTGAFALARFTGAPLVPVGFAAKPAVRIGSWDRMVVPLPFAKLVMKVGKPVIVPENADNMAVREAMNKTEEAIRELEKRALTELEGAQDV